MKTPIIFAAAAALFLAASPTNAQTLKREAITTIEPSESAGTVLEYLPDTISIRTTEGAPPMNYSFTKTTQYVDEDGNLLTRETVKTGVPVTISYVKEGDRMIVNRVIVRKQVTPAPGTITTKKTTTTTTTKKD